MSSTTLYPPSTAASTQSLHPTNPRSSAVSTKKKKDSDRIPAKNCCALFFYNIPRGSIMITLPGFAILAIGAILIATFPSSPSKVNWMDGVQLISFIFLILGGAWTLGGLIYWVAVWCRYRPKATKTPGTGWNDSRPENPQNQNGDLELVRVYRVDSNGMMAASKNGTGSTTGNATGSATGNGNTTGNGTGSATGNENTNGRVFTVS